MNPSELPQYAECPHNTVSSDPARPGSNLGKCGRCGKPMAYSFKAKKWIVVPASAAVPAPAPAPAPGGSLP